MKKKYDAHSILFGPLYHIDYGTGPGNMYILFLTATVSFREIRDCLDVVSNSYSRFWEKM